MAAATQYGTTNFNSDGTPKATTYSRAPIGKGGQVAIETVPTTALDDVGDFFAFFAVPAGKRLLALGNESTDMDSGTAALDMDWVLRTIDKNGVVTDTTLVDTSARGAATYFGVASSATQKRFVLGSTGAAGVIVPDDADSMAIVGLKTLVVAATAVQGTVYAELEWI